MDRAGQKQQAAELHTLNRALQAINKCSQALLHANDEMELLHETSFIHKKTPCSRQYRVLF